jgi:hypothetical protein
LDTTTIVLLTVVLAHFVVGFVVLAIKLSPKKKKDNSDAKVR